MTKVAACSIVAYDRQYAWHYSALLDPNLQAEMVWKNRIEI